MNFSLSEFFGVVLYICAFDYTTVVVSERFNRFNHTSWLALVTTTDSPKSVPQSLYNRSFWWRFVLSRCFLDFSVGVGAFVIGLSQISFFFS